MFNLRPTSIFDFPSDFDNACSALSLGCLPLSLVTSQRSAQLSPPLEVRRSGVHGRGVYATQFIPEGTRIIEYTGQRVSWEDAPNDESNPHTFNFGLESGEVINPEIDAVVAQCSRSSIRRQLGKDDIPRTRRLSLC